MERRLKLLAALTLLSGSAAYASPINFNEATGGELDINPCRPVGFCPFPLDFGANRFVGSSAFDLSDPDPNNRTYDFDVVTFRTATPVRLRINYEILDLQQSSDYTAPWTMSFFLGPVVPNGSVRPSPYCGTGNSGSYQMFNPISGALLATQVFDCIMDSPAGWDWRLGHISLGGSGDNLQFSYRMTLLVTPVPEPGTLLLLTLGLAGLSLGHRRRTA